MSEGMVVRSLERANVRTRESGVTRSAWRMTVESDEGSGTITRIDSDGSLLHRGDGVFLGWSQEQLATVYETLNAPSDEPQFELHQLG